MSGPIGALAVMLVGARRKSGIGAAVSLGVGVVLSIVAFGVYTYAVMG